MYGDVKQLAQEIGFDKCGEIAARLVPCDPTLRRFCVQNVCGMYNSCYMCPPAEGPAEVLVAKLHNYKDMLVFAREYPCEDMNNYMAVQREHENNSHILWKAMQKLGYTQKNARVLTTGGCHLCEVCGYKTGEPCRHPDIACPSVSGYCIEVQKLCDAIGLSMNGENGGMVLFCIALLK